MQNTGIKHEGLIAGAVAIGGAVEEMPILVPGGDWSPYLPDFERQAKLGLETMNCVQFSFLNVLETLAKFYGKPLNLSDRFLYWASGCTENGNTYTACLYGFRERGSCAESLWPWLVEMSRATYGTEPPADIKAEALKVFDEWDLGMLRYIIPTPQALAKALEKSPIWFCNQTHSMMMYNVDDMLRVFDTYPGNFGDGRGAFPLDYAPNIMAAYAVPFTPKKPNPPMPAIQLPENSLITGVMSDGLRLALHVGGKLLIHPDKAEVFAQWVARNENPTTHLFTGGPTRTISEKDWNSLPHVNFKGEPVA